MTAILKTCYGIASSFLSYVDTLCKPNPKYTPNQAEQIVAKTRNKIVFTIHFICFFVYLSDHFVTGASLVDCLFRSFLCLAVITFLFLSCRFHPQIFHIIYALVCITYGPGVMDSGPEGLLAAWMMAPALPTFHFLFTGNFKHFAVQSCIQFIMVSHLYYHRMEAAVLTMTPEAFTLALKQAFTLVLIVQIFIIILTNYLMKQAYNRILVTEQKRAEVENQKIFLLGFSHELRNLINSLAGNVKLVSLEENISNRAQELLLNAEVCGELLLHLVNNILDTGKVEIGELEINPTPTKIYDALEKVWGICSELIRHKELRGTMKIHKNIPRTLLTDNYRLTQIFLNLVGNAIKYTEKGAITICVKWISGRSQISEECFMPYPFNDEDDQDEGLFEKNQDFRIFDNNFLTLDIKNKKINMASLTEADRCERGVLKVTITDTGCGMNKQEMGKLFQKFTQVSSDPSKRKLGTGLGLFISKQICTRSDGEVRVFSKKDAGSCFTFCLPVATAPIEDEVPTDLESLKAIIQRKQLRAMIVDDIPFNHQILTTFFNRLGIQVIDIAVNGAEAYEKYLAHIRKGDRPQIVAMDIDMPVMDGKESSRLIRELEVREGLIPCFLGIVSGNCTESETRVCLDKQGSIKADAFIRKPACFDELIRTIGYHFIRE